MPQTFPATFNDSSGLQRLDGTINFTGSATQAITNVQSFPITFATASLNAGVTLYTPAVGDIILDIGVVITTAFNGTTPKIDVGTFNGGNVGLFGEITAGALDATKVYADVTDNAGLAQANSFLWLSAAVIAHASASEATLPAWQLRVSAANPILVVASQNGQKSGTAITSNAGVAQIVVVSAQLS